MTDSVAGGPPAEAPPTTHELKTWHEPFAAVCNGSKLYEVRFDDRGFRLGDFLRLRDVNMTGYTGEEVTVGPITYITHLPEWVPGVTEAYAVLGFPALGAPEALGHPGPEVNAVRKDFYKPVALGAPGQDAAPSDEGLRVFAKRVIDAHRDGCDLDGGDIQDWAVEAGLLIPTVVTEPCCEGCRCAEWDDFPQECYRDAPVLARSPRLDPQ